MISRYLSNTILIQELWSESYLVIPIDRIDRFDLMNIAFSQLDYRVDKNLEIVADVNINDNFTI